MNRIIIGVVLLTGGLLGLSMTLCGATFFGMAVYEFFKRGSESTDLMIMGWLMGLLPGAAILFGTWRIVMALRSPTAAVSSQPPDGAQAPPPRRTDEQDSNPWR